MKKKLLKNLSWKILSLCLAFIVWILIVNIDDPVITKTITDVPVEIKNEEAVQEKDKVYEVIEGGTVSVYVKGKRSDVDNLKASDILATADLSELSEWNAVPIIVSCRKFSEKEVEVNLTGKTQTLKIALENRITKQFQVSVVVNGSVAEGFYLSQTECKPNLINVTGGQSAINRIEGIHVSLNVEGASDNISKKLEPKAFDSDGNEIDSENLHFSSDSVRVKAYVWETKTVSLVVSPTGDVAYGYELEDLNYEPKTLLLAGPQENLSQISRINLSVDVSGIVADKEYQIILEEALIGQLPDNVKVADGTESIAVQASVKKQTVKDFSIAVDDIEMRNKDERYEYTVEGTAPVTCTVTLMGPEEMLDSFSIDDYSIYIDFSDAGEGTHIFNLEIEDLPDSLVLTNNPGITVSIERKRNGNSQPSPSPSPGAGGGGNSNDNSDEETPSPSPEPPSDGDDEEG